MKPIGIDFACNDPDNGLFDGRIEQASLYYPCGDPLFELEARSDPAPLLTRLDAGAIRISGKRWPIVGEREWVGNWCWNRYFFGREVAADLLIWFHTRRLFSLSCAEERLFTAWRGTSFGALRPFLVAQLAEIAG